MGDYAKAEPLYQRALKIREKALGPDHPDTAQALNNLAATVLVNGRLRQSRTALSARAQDLRESPWPRSPRHRHRPSTIWRHCIIPWAITPKPNRFFSARSRSYEKALGPDHPDTARSPQQSGDAVSFHGRLRQSRTALSARAQDQRESPWPRSPRHRPTLNNLAVLKIDLGEVERCHSFADERATGAGKISIEYSFIHLRTTAPGISENNQPIHITCHIRQVLPNWRRQCFGKKAWCSTRSWKIAW